MEVEGGLGVLRALWKVLDGGVWAYGCWSYHCVRKRNHGFDVLSGLCVWIDESHVDEWEKRSRVDDPLVGVALPA